MNDRIDGYVHLQRKRGSHNQMNRQNFRLVRSSVKCFFQHFNDKSRSGGRKKRGFWISRGLGFRGVLYFEGGVCIEFDPIFLQFRFLTAQLPMDKSIPKSLGAGRWWSVSRVISVGQLPGVMWSRRRSQTCTNYKLLNIEGQCIGLYVWVSSGYSWLNAPYRKIHVRERRPMSFRCLQYWRFIRFVLFTKENLVLKYE